MNEVTRGHVYDYPKYYDLIFGSGSNAEFDFLNSCFEIHSRRQIRRVFEPACGTGRLLIKFAKSGVEVSGSDLNRCAVEYCNVRLKKNGFPATTFVGDMADFALLRKADAVFNLINGFRHLLSEGLAERHFKSVASNLAMGGLYVLGLHLIPTRGKRMLTERSSARRGRLSIVSHMWSKRLNLRKRLEVCGMSFDVPTVRGENRIEGELALRTYTARQMRMLLNKIPQLEVAATYDFRHKTIYPILIGPETQDVVYILRRC